jgi:hypothetical protein
MVENFGCFHKTNKSNFYVNAHVSLNEIVACVDILFGKMLSRLIKTFSEKKP